MRKGVILILNMRYLLAKILKNLILVIVFTYKKNKYAIVIYFMNYLITNTTTHFSEKNQIN
jgi:hypothetical protein